MSKKGLPSEATSIVEGAKEGFSLIEVLVCLSIILMLGSISAAYLKTSSQAVKRQAALGSLIKNSNNFLEKSKTVPFGSLPNYNDQTLANGKLHIQVETINPHLYKITLTSDHPKLEICTLRSDYE
ncbi:MAG: type II secretion system protein [Candidatus Saganbacteria bacterium]|nr:type II secretion system protein [Candidatus Saganbacteria bacterium]